MDDMENSRPCVLAHELRRLTLSHAGDVSYLLDHLEDDAERFSELYYACIRSNAPVRKLLRLFEPLLAQPVEDLLISHSMEFDPRAIMLQVGLGLRLYAKSSKARMAEFVIQRLDMTSLWTSDQGLQRLRKIIITACPPAQLGDFCCKGKFSAGLATLLGCVPVGNLHLEEAFKWMSENAKQLLSMPLVLSCLARIIRNSSRMELQSTFVPTLQRLLLRNSSGALNLFKAMGKFTNDEGIFDDLGDAFWSLFTSESDDARESAHKVILENCSTLYLLSKAADLVNGRSMKVKKAALTAVYASLTRMVPSSQSDIVGILPVLWGMEPEDELKAWRRLVDGPELDLDSAYKEARQKLPRAPNTPFHQLVLALCRDADKQFSAKDLWAALKHTGFLTEKNINDALSRHPTLPLDNLINLFGPISCDEDSCIALWKIILSHHLGSARRSKDLLARLISLESVPAKSLALACLDLSNSITAGQAARAYKLMSACVRTRENLLDLLIVSHTGVFAQIDAGRLRVPADGLPPLSGDKVLGTILIRKDRAVATSASSLFPQAVDAFGRHTILRLEAVASLRLSDDDIRIVRSSDDALPIIDVVTPMRKAQEAAMRKDPLKKSLNPASPVNAGMSKAEKAAFDIEVQREKELRATMLAVKAELRELTELAHVFNQSQPRLLEPFLQDLAKFYDMIHPDSWVAEELVAILYAFASSSSEPLGSRGPLIVTCLLLLKGCEQFIDKNWCIRDCQMALCALCNHLDATLTSASSFFFTLPIVLEILRNACRISLGEGQATTIFSFLEENASHKFSNGQLLIAVLCASSTVAYLSIVTSKALLCFDKIIQHTILADQEMIDYGIFLNLLRDPSQSVRRFGMHVIAEMIISSPPSVLPMPVLCWLTILKDDPCCVESFQRLEVSFSKNRVGSPKWKDIFNESLDPSVEASVADIAMSALCSQPNEGGESLLAVFSRKYQELFGSRKPEIIDVRSKETDLTADIRTRLAKAFRSLATNSAFDEGCLPEVLKFCFGFAFLDPVECVQTEFLNAAGSMIDGMKGREHVLAAADVCDGFLSHKAALSDAVADRVRVYAVIILSKLSCRFNDDDSRRKSALESLCNALETPSESVQNAVADAMIPLFDKSPAHDVAEYFEKFLFGLVKGKTIAVRRGAAYGLGALVKGSGSRNLKRFEVLERLAKILHDKSAPLESKQGALFGLELLALYIGRNFEPYIIVLVDVLILVFGDGRVEIKEAASDAADAMIRNVSALGSQLLLPSLLALLDSNAWRSKVGALEWLGAMANLAPRVFAKQLPKILPKVLDALGDSHHAVQTAAREALNRYVAVVRTPEVKAMAHIIMDALANPPQYTEKCLDTLLHTAFAHVIDGPSMALIEPILVRSLRDRATGGTEMKKKAAQILGNLATNLIDPRDLTSTLERIVPALVLCLSDPVPEVRSNCGKVLGILAQTVGESTPAMKGLVPELFSVIGGPFATSVDRAGAAQALAEIFAARGPHETAKVLQKSVLSTLASTKAKAREGYVMLLGYLPAAFDSQGKLAQVYELGLRDSLAPAIGLLADDNEAVREAATTSCHQVISRIARIDCVAVFDILLDTLSDPRWRCRLGCLQLFQEFLSKFASGESDASMGIFAMPDVDELTNGGIDIERVSLLMAKAFLYRFDGNSSSIRHLSLNIWKGLASHPLRALAQILPILLEEGCLLVQSNCSEGQEMVSKALDDMLGKIGDRVILSLLDTLRSLFEADQEESPLFLATQAISLFGSASFPNVTNAVSDQVIKKVTGLVQQGLYSGNPEVRKASCRLFRKLSYTSEAIGMGGCIEALLDPILEELMSDPIIDPVTLDALIALLEADDTRTVLKKTFDCIINSWRNVADTECASSLCSITIAVFDCVAGAGASKCVPVLEKVVNSTQYAAVAMPMLDAVIKSILAALDSEEDSPYQVSLSQLLENLYSEGRAADAFRIIALYCRVEGADLSRFYNIWPVRICSTINESEQSRLAAIALIETASSEHILTLAYAVNEGIRTAATLEPQTKAVIPLIVKNLTLPLLSSSNLLVADDEERRSLACQLSCVLASKTASSAWSSSLTTLVGALIRAASDRKTTSTAVFEALTRCTIAQTTLVKPFHPQLQRIFLNALAMESVRCLAGDGLVALIPALSRPEQALSEIFSMAENDDENEIQITAFGILSKICIPSEADRCLAVARTGMSSQDPKVRQVASVWVEGLARMPAMSQHEKALTSLLALL